MFGDVKQHRETWKAATLLDGLQGLDANIKLFRKSLLGEAKSFSPVVQAANENSELSRNFFPVFRWDTL